MENNSAPAPAATTPAATSNANGQAPAAAENVVRVEGVLDIDTQKGGNGQLIEVSRSGKRRPTDTVVPKELIRCFKLKQGSIVAGTAYPAEGKFPNPKMKFIEKVDGLDIDERRHKMDFNSLTTVS